MENYHTSAHMHVTDITLMVADIKKSLLFYQHSLGLKLIHQSNEQYHLGTHTNHVLLTLISNPLAAPKVRATGLYHFALLLPSRAHLGQFIQHMIDTKTPVTGGADHGISEALYLDDPDGHGIEIYADKPKSAWPDFEHIENKPMAYQDLINNRLNEDFTKIPDRTIMGHIHLHVSNMKVAKDFFIDALGFESTMAYGPHAAFVSHLGYHHHIGFNVWNGLNIPNNPENAVGLKSFTLFVPSNLLDAFKSNLKALNITLNETDDSLYLYDINAVKVIIKTSL